MLERLREASPRARMLVRLDGGFAASELFGFLEEAGCDHVVAMAKNRRLAPRATELMGKARRLSRRTGKTAHVYGETRYAARRCLDRAHFSRRTWRAGRRQASLSRDAGLS